MPIGSASADGLAPGGRFGRSVVCGSSVATARRGARGGDGRPAACSRGTQAEGGYSGSEVELNLALARATSTGVRVVGLRLSGYAVGFVASIMIARAVGPTGRGLYAYPVAMLGLVMALAHLGLEFAQVHLAARGKDLRHMWADATVFSVVAGIVGWVGVMGVVSLTLAVAGGLPLSWIAVPMGLVPLLLMSLYWANLLQLDGRLVMATWASWFGVALQMAAIGVLFLTHELTPFRVLLLQWLTNGSAWFLLLLACRRAGLVTLRIDPSLLRRSLAFGVKAYVAQIFFYLVLRVDQVLVAQYDGYRQLGLYALATTVAELLWLLTDPLAGALMPHMVRARAGGRPAPQLLDGANEPMHFDDWCRRCVVSGTACHSDRLRGRVRRRRASVAAAAAWCGRPRRS